MGLSALRRLYGWVAIGAGVIVFVAFPKLTGPNPFAFPLLVVIFLSIFGWVSLMWCIDHLKNVSEVGWLVALFVFSPLLMGAFDLLMGIPFTNIFAEALRKSPNPRGWEFPHLSNPIAISALISLIFAVFFAVYYAIMWFLTIPAIFASAVLVALPVALARFIDTIAPHRAFVGFTFVLFTLVTLWSLWL